MFGCFVNLWEVEGLFCKSLGSTVYGWVVSKFEVFFLENYEPQFFPKNLEAHT
jgi:hypothetical protein